MCRRVWFVLHVARLTYVLQVLLCGSSHQLYHSAQSPCTHSMTSPGGLWAPHMGQKCVVAIVPIWTLVTRYSPSASTSTIYMQIVHSAELDENGIAVDDNSFYAKFMRRLRDDWDVIDEGPMTDLLGT
jgi:hypothetical protein